MGYTAFAHDLIDEIEEIFASETEPEEDEDLGEEDEGEIEPDDQNHT